MHEAMRWPDGVRRLVCGGDGISKFVTTKQRGNERIGRVRFGRSGFRPGTFTPALSLPADFNSAPRRERSFTIRTCRLRNGFKPCTYVQSQERARGQFYSNARSMLWILPHKGTNCTVLIPLNMWVVACGKNTFLLYQ